MFSPLPVMQHENLNFSNLDIKLKKIYIQCMWVITFYIGHSVHESRACTQLVSHCNLVVDVDPQPTTADVEHLLWSD